MTDEDAVKKAADAMLDIHSLKRKEKEKHEARRKYLYNHPKIKRKRTKQMLKRWKVKEVITRGGFSSIRKILRRSDNKKFVLKTVRKVRQRERIVKLMVRQINVMKDLDHVNIPHIEEIVISPNYFLMIMTFCEGCILSDVIYRGEHNEAKVSCYVRQIASALDYLHERDIVHRDVKPESILVYQPPNADPVVTLASFSIARKMKNGEARTLCGHPEYVAPEIVMKNPYGSKADIWALGITIYSILCGYLPFWNAENDRRKLWHKIKRCEYEFPESEWNDISADAKNLVKSLLRTSPQKRLTGKQIIEHSFCVKKQSTESLSKNVILEMRKESIRRKLYNGCTTVRAVLKIKEAMEAETKEKCVEDDDQETLVE